MESFKPYSEYKDAHIPWLESVPSHWEVKRAKSLYRKIVRPVEDSDEVVTCFRDGTVTLRKNRRLTGFTESLKEIGYQGIRKGDLVIHVMDAFAGAVGVSDSDGKATPVYSVCESKIELNNYYFAFIIREMAKTKFIQSLYRGIRERSSDFRFEIFANQYLPFPPLEEQKKIVAYLDYQLTRIKKLIKLKKNLILLLKEQKQAIINEAVTKGLKANSETKFSDIEGVETIPEHWEVKPLKHYVRSNIETVSDIYNMESIIDYIDISTVGFGELKKSPVSYKLSDAPSRARRIVHYGDTIISTVRTYLKSICFVDESIQNCVVSTGFAVLTPNKNVYGKLLNYVLSSSYFLDSVSKNSIGISYPAISEDKLISLKIALPVSIKEQQEILEYIERETHAVDKGIALLEKEIQLITEYGTRLTSDIVTGKFCIQDIEVSEIQENDLQLEEILELEEDLEAEEVELL